MSRPTENKMKWKPKWLHIYPRESAMHGAVEITIRGRGYITIYPPIRSTNRGWPWGVYFSPDATPSHERARGFGPYWRLRHRVP